MVIKIHNDGTEEGGIIDDNVIQPFSLEKTNVRGRVVRLGTVLQDIMGKHQYPPPVSLLLSELTALAMLLSAMLKYEGIFTLQVKSDGAIKTMVVDTSSDGKIRAYAGYDAQAVKKLAKRTQEEKENFYHLLGSGYLAFTVDQGNNMERYQGIVELHEDGLIASVKHYFNQSEQIKTSFKLAIHPQDEICRAGAIMIQHIPDENDERAEDKEECTDEDWRRAKILLETCREDELLSPVLHSADVLYRLFHEDGVRVYPALPLKHECRCSQKRAESVVASLPVDDIEHILDEQGEFVMKCEFCSHEYHLTENDIKILIEQRDNE